TVFIRQELMLHAGAIGETAVQQRVQFISALGNDAAVYVVNLLEEGGQPAPAVVAFRAQLVVPLREAIRSVLQEPAAPFALIVRELRVDQQLDLMPQPLQIPRAKLALLQKYGLPDGHLAEVVKQRGIPQLPQFGWIERGL